MDDVRSLFRHLYCGSELFDAILAVSAEGIYVHDTEGRVYIDYPFKPRPLGRGTLCWGSKGA